MKSWKEFREAEPVLKRIERRFSQLQRFEKKYQALGFPDEEFSEQDLQDAKAALLESIKADAMHVKGKVYYWLYPFYTGNFLQLVAALGSCGMMEKQKDDPQSRNAFYAFFKTVPLQERLELGKRLNHPELTEQATKIQKKIQAKKDALKKHMNQHHAN